MPKIKQLSASVINKIAAGEVIERPASVVKELLENAVDSGATRIDLAVEQGGAALVRVSDNGCGITKDDLPLAVASHATSKITDADDLFCVRSLGFRGEALASIAEISHFRLRSRTGDDDAGYELEVTGGQYAPIAPCGCPIGTTVEVRNLFCNTPVRRKFMRTTQTEMGHSSEAFTRIALAHPNIHFTLRHGERTLFDLAPCEGWRDRIGAFFGGEVNENLMWVESCDDLTKVSGYVADPQISRSNNRMQYLFLNGRFIRDRSLQHALTEAYRGLLMVGRFPVAFLQLDLPPDSIDVNVHPTKMEVRFRDSGKLYSQTLSTLRSRFLASDLTAKVPNSAAPDSTGVEPGGPHSTGTEAAGAASGVGTAFAREHRQRLSAWARGDSGGVAAAGMPGLATQESFQERLPLGPTAPPARPFKPFGAPGPAGLPGVGLPGVGLPGVGSPGFGAPDVGAPGAPVAEWTSADEEGSVAIARNRSARPAGLQLHNRYLVAEDEQGMVVIDQHALHERILYEQIRAKTLEGKLESQKLLVPESVSLTAAESAAALGSREVLAQLGIQIEPFGGDTVLMATYPAMLGNMAPQEILRQVVDLLLAEGKSPDRRDVLDELLHMISCKAAIKAGDHLASEEIEELLEQRLLYQDSHHCPHGRPTALLFSREELDRRFKRT